jgi:hypothetical protein
MDLSMEEILTAAFDETARRYAKIFKGYYPAHGSTGFTERNLTNNFVSSLEKVHENCIPWFEAPIDVVNKKHIDAVVFAPDLKSSVMIESKRFNNPNAKMKEIFGDLDRIRNESNQATIEKGIKGFEISKKYGVLLADVWIETKLKKQIFEDWDPIIREKSGIIITKKTGAEDLQVESDWPQKYKILMAIIDLNEERDGYKAKA